MTSTFAELIEGAMRRRGWNDYQLSGAIGLLPGDRVFNAKQVWRLRTGAQRHVDRDLVDRLAEVLNLDPDEAYRAAGLWPEGLDVLGLRRLRAIAADPDLRSHVDKRLAAGGSGNPVCIIPLTAQRVRVLLAA